MSSSSSSTLVPIHPGMVVPSPVSSEAPPRASGITLQRILVTIFGILSVQLILCIIALCLWQASQETPCYVLLSIACFSDEIIKLFFWLFGSIQPTKELEITLLRFEIGYNNLRTLLALQIFGFYSQRTKVPDVWVFSIMFVLFLAYSVKINFYDIRNLWSSLNPTLKKIVAAIFVNSFLSIVVVIIFFGLTARAHYVGSPLQDYLPIGALFVPILFGIFTNTLVSTMLKLMPFFSTAKSSHSHVQNLDTRTVANWDASCVTNSLSSA
jgi:hypothetical protein